MPAEDRAKDLAPVRDALRAQAAPLALQLLRDRAAPGDDAVLHSQYARFAKALAKQLPDLPELRVAFLANATLDHWVDCLRFWLLLEGFRLEPLIVPFGTWPQQVMDPDSELYQFRPAVVWFFTQANDLRLDTYQPAEVEQRGADLSGQLSMVSARLPALLVVNNLPAPSSRIYGNLDGSMSGSVADCIDHFNRALPKILPAGSAVFDIRHLAARFGLDRWEDPRMWYHSKHPFSLDAHGPVAFSAARMLAAARGRARKCLVLDLDNTLWGGVVGDDGIDGIQVGPDGGAVGEAYASFQSWLKALARRGIALAVCSKNNEELAREPFLRKRGMVLDLNDLVAFKANWDNKADNIRAIARDLNLGLDALVFVDDNPAERALVRQELPQVGVPEMPVDPADYVRALASGAWFETLAVTSEDLSRVQAYRENIARSEAQARATDLGSYLEGLEMRAGWGTVDASTLPRVAQLVNKTNQFNLTTQRYTEAEIQALSTSPDSWVGHFSLRDRFGDHGLIAVVILAFDGPTARIDTWVMSCRVFSRQMEHFTFGVIQEVARRRRARYLKGTYIPSPKNAVVADLYQRFGGRSVGDPADTYTTWSFDLEAMEPMDAHHIQDMTVAET